MKYLVDTSVWINHLRFCDKILINLLEENLVITHPFVIGEIATGNLKNRSEILTLLSYLPNAEIASHDEVLSLIESKKLYGKGLGIVDMHLLASAMLSNSILLSYDKRLQTIFNSLSK